MLLISGDQADLDRNALRRSGVNFGAGLDGRDKECCCCFRPFTAILEEIASSGSENADADLGFSSSLLEMVHFLMEFRKPLYRGFLV